MIHGWGINDVPGAAARNGPNKKIYATWQDMIRRCHSDAYQDGRPTYINTIVCEEWKYYSCFEQWYLKHYVDGYKLDKDIIGGNSRIYSPETCAFVPNIINTCIIDPSDSNKVLPIGVGYINDEMNRTKPYIATVKKFGKRKQLGVYSTPEEAHRAWQKAKKEYIIELSEKYEHNVIPEVIDGLLRRVSILEDDLLNNRITTNINKV